MPRGSCLKRCENGGGEGLQRDANLVHDSNRAQVYNLQHVLLLSFHHFEQSSTEKPVRSVNHSGNGGDVLIFNQNLHDTLRIKNSEHELWFR